MSHELIQQLAASNSDNAVEQITLGVRELGLRYGWSLEECCAVADFAVTLRHSTIETTLEAAMMGLKEVMK